MISPDSMEKEEVYLPYSGNYQTSDTIIFQNTLPEEYANLTLQFSTENADVRVLLDEEMIYEWEVEDINAESQHYVYVPNAMHKGEIWGELRIELTVLNQDREITLSDIIMVGASDVVVIGMTSRNLTNIACYLLIVIMAVIVFVLGLIIQELELRQKICQSFPQNLSGLRRIGTATLKALD